jgi:hypothetical protein
MPFSGRVSLSLRKFKAKNFPVAVDAAHRCKRLGSPELSLYCGHGPSRLVAIIVR